MHRKLFAYGTLMCEDILASVAGCSPLSSAAVLRNFCRFRVRDEHYPGLIRCAGGQVDGVLYRELGPAVWARLDRFEGSMYECISVTVETGHGASLQADTYLVRPEFESRLEPVEWDFEAFLVRGKEEFVREYSGYETVASQPD